MEENFVSISLPSGCRIYDGVDPTKIQARTFKGKDEKLIAEIAGDNLEKKFLAVFRDVLKGIEPEKLTNGDRLYILVWEAINSYTPEYPITYTCSACLQQSNAVVDLSKLELIELPEDFKEPYEVQLSTGEIAKLKLFRVEDEIKIADFEKTGKGSWLYRYATTIIGEGSLWDKVAWLENLPSKDLAMIRAVQDKFVHGPKMEQECECVHCGVQEAIACPFRLDMLFPYGKGLERYLGKTI